MNKQNQKNQKQLALRIAIAIFMLTLVMINKPVHAQTILLDGPYQTRVSFQVVTPSPSFIEQPVTVTVQVESIDSLGGVPSGVVEIKTGAEKICEITLNAGGFGSCSLTFDTPSVVPLQAFYIGTDTYLPAASTTYNQQVLDKYHPVVTIESDLPDPSIVNRIVRVDGQVSSQYTQPITGMVTVYRSTSGVCSEVEALTAIDECSFSVDAAGAGSCDLSITTAGVVNLCAVYGGDIAHYAGVSQAESHTVSLSNTFVEIVSINPQPSDLSESVNITYQVTSPDGNPQTGIVVIYSGSTALCSATAAAGVCSGSLSVPNENTIYGVYSGEMDGQIVLQPSVSDPVLHYVQAPPTAIHLSKQMIDAYRDKPNVVAVITVDDPNPGDQFVYTLVSGEGDDDNRYFSIQGDLLYALGNIPVGDSWINIRIRATDQSGLYVEEQISIRINNNQPELPNTGFAPQKTTTIGTPKIYYKTYGELTIEIPGLATQTAIVGVPINNNEWDTTWLGDQVGWLHGSVFPGWLGNTYLAGHNYLASGNPGPFEKLDALKWGDQILIHSFGTTSVYEVRSVQWVSPENNQVLTHDENAWLTLVTCDQYDDKTGAYRWRVIVRAVLVDVY